MKVVFGCDANQLRIAMSDINGIIQNVHNGVKWATELSCKIIFDESQFQVPKDTGTLAASGFYQIDRRTELARSSYRYRGIIGYGGNGDPANPETGLCASAYARIVHEDLTLTHKNGKAKFLEDPLRDFAYGGELYAIYAEYVRLGIRRID